MIMAQSKALLVIMLLLVSPTFTAASPNQEVMHPNMTRAYPDGILHARYY